jgi:alanyl-tRNA synthetase
MTAVRMTGTEIRRSFLDYFASQDHRIVSSSSLVPVDDPTLLFTNAGMNQFKDVFLGRERRDYRRATTSQKCMRVSGKHNDLDNVGPSHRHHTFFEMLGNFSFGDYFKEDAIRFAWTVLTEVWGLPKDRLRASVFAGDATTPRDDEAFAIWKGILGDASRIDEFGAADNFWQMGETGPCGRCSEIFYDRRGMSDVPADDQLIEVWNNVFMEFNRLDGGVLEPLPARSIDTGMGLERITAVIQGRTSNYDTDLFQPILQAIGDLAGRRYGADAAADVSMRVVADHLRATTFLIGDGVIPSNEWRGYVLRKIMRRAMRHGKRLGLREPFLHALVDVVVREFGGAYPDLPGSRDAVVNVVKGEEERFDAVLTAGLPRLEDLLDRAAASPDRRVPGDEMFRLYDSLGVPVDFMEDLAGERQLAIDREGYERAMEGQRERARAGSAFDQRKAAGFSYASDLAKAAVERTPDQFAGYETTTVDDATIVALFDATRAQVDALAAGAEGWVVVDRTPFYLEAGGQVSDAGGLSAGDGEATVTGTLARVAPGGPRAHHVTVTRGALEVNARATLAVDAARRDAIRRNHTATHLLHAALRRVLGPHVKQAGSLVAPDRLRFDFVQPSAIPAEAIGRIERLINDHVLANTPVTTEVKPTNEAMAAGAMALFGEKYGDTVRVVSIPGFSLELCGGTHVRATGDIGLVAITAESGVAAGVRRIEAVTGTGAYEHYATLQRGYHELLHVIGADAGQARGSVEKLQAEVKRLGRELQDAKVKAAMGGGTGSAGAGGGDDRIALNGAALIARRADGLDRAGLRTLADSLKEKLGSGVVVLAAEADGKVSLVVSVTKDLIGRVQAGQVVKQIAPIVGGGGGGRPDFAEAGGKDPGKIADLLKESRVVVERMLGTAGG